MAKLLMTPHLASCLVRVALDIEAKKKHPKCLLIEGNANYIGVVNLTNFELAKLKYDLNLIETDFQKNIQKKVKEFGITI